MLASLPAIEVDNRVSIRHLDVVHLAALSDLADAVKTGLTATSKYIPPQFFYDERGSWLFERICETREYYPTRTEDGLLKRFADSIIQTARPDAIVELGSGSSRKTARLFQACGEQGCHSHYQPVDVCAEILAEAGRRLAREHDWLTIEALVGDYSQGLAALPACTGRRLFLFLGGTIGNFTHERAVNFLKQLRSVMSPRDWFLLGADRVKDIDVLNAAYNDADGHTEAFNLNLLEVINRELDAEFDLDLFDHQAFFNQDESRIEMHLQARQEHAVKVRDLDMEITFDAGETILTEISRKFTPESLGALLRETGFRLDRHFYPENEYYSLVMARLDSAHVSV